MGHIKKLMQVTGRLMNEEIKGDFVSKSQKLFCELGLTHFYGGIGALSPILVKSLNKLKTLVRNEMEELSASEFRLPILTPSKLLKTSGRLDLHDILRVEQNAEEKKFVLSPTCEESAVNFIQSFPSLSSKNLPLRLYQIAPKFRDEKRAKSGLLRSKEFLMKDLYCFDSSLENSEKGYQEVLKIYQKLFDKLQVPYVCAKGDTGDIGGLYSHEFHFLADAGENEILLCQNCGYCENVDLMKDQKEKKCQACSSNNVQISKGIEVGHCFNTGTKYTEKFNAKYFKNKSELELLHMSSFGLGLTRLLAATVEVLCTPTKIVWPLALCPYLVCVLPPKSGSIQAKAAEGISELVYRNLNQCLNGEVILDDRTYMTIGYRLKYTEKIGFPYAVIIGKTICDTPPLVEVIDIYNNSKDFVQIPDVSQYLMNKLSPDSNLNLNLVKESKLVN